MAYPKFISYAEHCAAAQAAFKVNDFAGAAEIYRGIPEAFPGKKHAATFAAEGLLACGQWSDAVLVLQRALERFKGGVSILSHLSRACLIGGDPGRAAFYLRRFLDHDPRDIRQWRQLGDLYVQAGELSEALFSYNKVLAAEPLNVETAILRGDILADLGRAEEAIADYRRTEAIEPGNTVVAFKLGTLALKMGTPREAADHLRRAIAADPGNADAHVTLSLALISLGLYDDAARLAAAGLDLQPGFALGQFALGMALTGLERFVQASEALKLAADASPTSLDVLTALAEAEVGRGDLFAAERALQQVLSVDPDNSGARFMIAALHGEALEFAPPELAVATFDREAPRYDYVAGSLQDYAAAEAGATLLEDAEPARASFQSVADLGCGTGLAVAALRDAFRIDSATGIDVSEKMIEFAAKKNLYDRLVIGDAIGMLDALNEDFELITAVDLAPHLGRLSTLTTAVARHLVPGGLFLCSIEHTDAAGYQLRPSGRFAHDTGYLEETAQAAGLEILARRDLALRRIGGRPLKGLVALFRRPH